jgi:hypothetical protein
VKKIIAGLALAAALALTGCGVTASPVAEPAQPEATTPSAVPEAASEPEAQPEAEDMIFQFGETIEYVDGLGLSVSAAQPYTPSEFAATGDAPHNVMFNIKVTNNTPEPYTPSVWGTLASGGAEATQIFDSANGLVGGPSTAVLPGQTVEWVVGFNVMDPADLTFEVTAGSFEYKSAIFTTVVLP